MEEITNFIERVRELYAKKNKLSITDTYCYINICADYRMDVKSKLFLYVGPIPANTINKSIAVVGDTIADLVNELRQKGIL